MVEWIAISSLLTPFLTEYAKTRAAKLAEHQADGLIAKAWQRIVPGRKLIAANEAFVTRFGKTLDSAIDLPTLTANAYQAALAAFLKNPSAQDLILAPLDGESALDYQLLRGIWAEHHLIALPGEFSWPALARTYSQAIQRLTLQDPDLRPVIAALAQIRAAEAAAATADATRRIAGPARTFDLARYAKAIQQLFLHVRLGSLDTDWADFGRRVRLDSVYVDQSVKQALPPRELTRDYLRLLEEEGRAAGGDADRDRWRQEYLDRPPRPLSEVAGDPAIPRLVLLGDPGLGKSTFLKHLALRWAADPSAPLALFIELRLVGRTGGFNSFVDYMEKGASPLCCLPRLELDRHLHDNDSLVLFDALDEVPTGERGNAVAGIVKFAGDYPRARVIVTTRITGYHPGSTHPETFRDAGFEQFTLQDFDDPEIDGFIARWYQVAFADPVERERYAGRLRAGIGGSPAIRELAANPLLLTMMAIPSRTQDLPRHRARLYERCAEMLLRNWDLEKFAIRDRLGPDQKMRILERVAEAMQRERTGLEGNQIGESVLKEIVTAELQRLGIERPWEEAEDLISKLRERNFMLAYLGDRQYAFIHRTFLEYFCARDIQYRLEKTSALTVNDVRAIFRDRWQHAEWKEVLRLLCGVIGAEFAGQCVNELLACGQDNPYAVFMAVECLQEIREVGLIQGIRRAVREAVMGATRRQSSRFLDERPWDERYRIRGRAVRELVRGWGSDPDTLPLLKDRAARDVDESVRMVALQELARGWKSDPGTLPLLHDRAARDASWAVRLFALQKLARGWKSDLDTLPLLKDRAAGDNSKRVRVAAVQELADGWPDDPDVQAFLATLRTRDS
jgi:hypothetical protein